MTFHVGFGVLTAFVLYLKPHGWKITRSVFMIPNIISAAAWALIYRFIFNDQMGVLNSVIRVFDKDFRCSGSTRVHMHSGQLPLRGCFMQLLSH